MKFRLGIVGIPFVCGFLLGAAPLQGRAEGLLPTVLDPFGGSQHAPRRTWVEQRTWPVVLQRYDQGCGPAALATILRFLFDADVTEEELVQEMLLEKVAAGTTGSGFTFRDLMGALERRGYETLAGRAPLEELVKLALPAIVLVERREVRHFVVLWGVVEDRVHLGDPLIGNTTVPLTQFAREWLGVLLIVLPPHQQVDTAAQRVKNHLHYMEQLSLHRADPFGLTFPHRSLVSEGASLLVPQPGEF